MRKYFFGNNLKYSKRLVKNEKMLTRHSPEIDPILGFLLPKLNIFRSHVLLHSSDNC